MKLKICPGVNVLDLDLYLDDNCQTPAGYCSSEVCTPTGTI